MSRPPVSKVMPLPTRTTRGVLAVAPVGRVVELHEARRGRRGRADGEQPAEPLGPQLALGPHPHLEARAAGQRPGLGGHPGGVLGVGRDDGEVAGEHGGAGPHHRVPHGRLVVGPDQGDLRRRARAPASRRRRPIAGSSSRRGPAPRRRRTAPPRDGAAADRRHQRGVALAGPTQGGTGGAQVRGRRLRRRPPAAPCGPAAPPAGAGCVVTRAGLGLGLVGGLPPRRRRGRRGPAPAALAPVGGSPPVGHREGQQEVGGVEVGEDVGQGFRGDGPGAGGRVEQFGCRHGPDPTHPAPTDPAARGARRHTTAPRTRGPPPAAAGWGSSKRAVRTT